LADKNNGLLSSRCKKLDKIINGGLRSKKISQIYGKNKTGKSLACLLFTYQCLRGGNECVYITSGSFPTQRFTQITGRNTDFSTEELVSNLLISETREFNEQKRAIDDAAKIISNEKRDVGLLVIDSITSFYRSEMDAEKSIELKREMAKKLAVILGLSRRGDIPVLMTNEVYKDFDTGKEKLIGGRMLKDISHKMIEFKEIGSIQSKKYTRSGDSVKKAKDAKYRNEENRIKSTVHEMKKIRVVCGENSSDFLIKRDGFVEV